MTIAVSIIEGMAAPVVELHVPLHPTPGRAETDYPFPWIDEIEVFLFELEQEGEVAIFDDGEEFEGAYVFFLTGADETGLLAVASRASCLDGVPMGAFAMVTDDEAAEFGRGRRVDLPLP
ncbi:hypothetical protein J5X84_15990 [Streptosporangiaceae bacterium NEAU-GS5]|nr:hypothetical protein [Streptosporangiaceae bacterium NEAU-GS5]